MSVFRVDCAQDSEMVFSVTGSPVPKENRSYDLTKFSDTAQLNRLLKKRYGVFTATERQCANAQELCVEAENAIVWEELNIDAGNTNFWAGGSGSIWQQPGNFAGIQGADITRDSGTSVYLYARGLPAQAGSPQVFGDQQQMFAAQQPWFEQNAEYAGKTITALRIYAKVEAVGTLPSPDPDFALYANVSEGIPGSPKKIAGPDEINSVNVSAGQRIFTHQNQSGVLDIFSELDLVPLESSPIDYGLKYADWDSGLIHLNIWWLANYAFPVDYNTTTIRLYEVGIELVFA